MSKHQKYFDTNQQLWDNKTRIHIESGFYNMKGFLAGENSLRKIELEELPDLNGKTVFHSQCHFGQDTLSIQRMGAQCTGIDLSSVAIEKALEYNKQLGLQAKFHCCNVYEIDKHVTDLFDIVFTSYGTIGWLPNLERWAFQLASRLKKGGLFYMAEFHPTMHMFDWDKKKINYTYFHEPEPIMEVEEGTYANRDSDIKMKEYFWQHPLSAILNALIAHGIELISFNEFDYSPYPIFNEVHKRAEQEYLFQINDIDLPLVFSLKGIKK